jgi:hypothetical protein
MYQYRCSPARMCSNCLLYSKKYVGFYNHERQLQKAARTPSCHCVGLAGRATCKLCAIMPSNDSPGNTALLPVRCANHPAGCISSCFLGPTACTHHQVLLPELGLSDPVPDLYLALQHYLPALAGLSTIIWRFKIGSRHGPDRYLTILPWRSWISSRIMGT